MMRGHPSLSPVALAPNALCPSLSSVAGAHRCCCCCRHPSLLLALSPWLSALAVATTCSCRARHCRPSLVSVAVATVKAAVDTVVVATTHCCHCFLRCCHRPSLLLALSYWLSPLTWMTLLLSLSLQLTKNNNQPILLFLARNDKLN